MGHSRPLKRVPPARCPLLRTSWHYLWAMRHPWTPQCRMTQEPVEVPPHRPQTHQPCPQDPLMPSLAPPASRKQMRQHVRTFLRGHLWMTLSRKQGLLVHWRPAASRITKVGKHWQHPLLFFHAQYQDLGPTGHLGEWDSQPSLPFPSSAKGSPELPAYFSQARVEKGDLLPRVLPWI